WLLLSATATTGLLAGASLDQSIKQLPARHRIGAVAYSAYSRAADLGNGILFYGILGIGAAVLTIAAAIAAHVAAISTGARVAADLGAVLAVLHSPATTQAAPAMFSQRSAAKDPAKLTRLFNRFARWQAARAVLQAANFGVLIWGLVAAEAIAKGIGELF